MVTSGPERLTAHNVQNNSGATFSVVPLQVYFSLAPLPCNSGERLSVSLPLNLPLGKSVEHCRIFLHLQPPRVPPLPVINFYSPHITQSRSGGWGAPDQYPAASHPHNT